jgi:hypothetical protein
LQNSGEAYLSNAVINGKFALRACIVNFRTSLADVEALLPLIVQIGNDLDLELRPMLSFAKHNREEATYLIETYTIPRILRP